MGRFDRQDTGSDPPPATLGNATEELRSTFERQIGEIVNAAKERAAEIELEASDRAEKIEEDAAKKAQDLELEAQRREAAIKERESEQITRLLDRVNTLGDLVFGMLDDMRTELQKALDDRGGVPPSQDQPAQPAPVQDAGGGQPPLDLTSQEAIPAAPTEPVASELQAPLEAAPPDQQVNGQPSADQPAADPPAADDPPAPPHPADELTQGQPGPAGNTRPPLSPELDQMLREQLTTMFKDGKSRAEAAQFLMRFNLGKTYVGLIDEVYWNTSESTKPVTRQRFARRRRNRQR